MKVRVCYTYEIEDSDFRALQRYNGPERITRDDLRQMLADLGKMGVEEQISQGRTWLGEDAARDDVTRCDNCGNNTLQSVRPGKWQCSHCESVSY